MKKLRIVAVDDSVLVRDYLECAFSVIDGVDLVGMAADGDEALTMVRDLQPDVVVLDVSMPRVSGIEVLKEIRKEDQETVIIMFTSDASPVLEQVCLEAGANHYVVKTQFQDLMDLCKEMLATSHRSGTLSQTSKESSRSNSTSCW